MKISKISKMPEKIPFTCTSKFNVRIHPWRKNFLAEMALENNKSMSKVFLDIMDFYLKKNGFKQQSDYYHADLFEWSLSKTKHQYS